MAELSAHTLVAGDPRQGVDRREARVFGENLMAKYPSFAQMGTAERDFLVKSIDELLQKAAAERWSVPFAEITEAEFLKSTGTSVIHKCKWRGSTIVVKRVKSNKIALLRDISNEIALWSSLRHPHLVQFLGCSVQREEARLAILMEYVDGSNLTDLIDGKVDKSKLSTPIRHNLCTQLIRAFQFLHSCQPSVVYRDLKPDNVMVDNQMNVKLTDFGLSRFMPEDCEYRMTPSTGTLRYMPPEVYNGDHYGIDVDIYSLGLVIFFVHTGRKPFADFNQSGLVDYFAQVGRPDKQASHVPTFVDIHLRDLGDDVGLRQIIAGCTNPIGNRRWDINTLARKYDAFSSRTRRRSGCAVC